MNPHLDVSRRDDLDLETSVSSSALSIAYPTLNLSVNAVLRHQEAQYLHPSASRQSPILSSVPIYIH